MPGMKLHFSDEVLIEGLRQQKRRDIEYMYQEFTPVLRHFLKNNRGTPQDMQDLFQEAMIVLYKRCMKDSFRLECSLKTYFISICKNLWLQRLDRRFRLLYQADFEVQEPAETYTMEDQDLREENLEQQRLFYKNLMSLPGDCRRIIELYCLKIPYREIARLMNYKDEVYVKTRKYSCKNLLRKRILSDPEYQQFLDYERISDHP